MGDLSMSNQIMKICEDTPEVGALACFLHDQIEDYAKRSPNMLLSYSDIFSLAKKFDYYSTKQAEEFSVIAIQVLCNPSIDFLKLKYFFIDDFNDPIEIEIREVIDAHASRSLEHPYTGELVYDYKNYVFPFFTVDDN